MKRHLKAWAAGLGIVAIFTLWLGGVALLSKVWPLGGFVMCFLPISVWAGYGLTQK